MKPQVFIVFLRRPRKCDARRDPFWEFGSFGCTGCHRHNLLHPSRCRVRDGDRLAFVQGGPLGCRLLLVTPPVKRILHSSSEGTERVEVRWKPARKPFRYATTAPLLAGDAVQGATQFPRLTKAISNAARPSLESKLASCFRARATALEDGVAEEVLAGFNRALNNSPPEAFIKRYTDALPWFDPEVIPTDRRQVYKSLLEEVSGTLKSTQHCGKRRHAPCR